jgi:hypothetical protein
MAATEAMFDYYERLERAKISIAGERPTHYGILDRRGWNRNTRGVEPPRIPYLLGSLRMGVNSVLSDVASDLSHWLGFLPAGMYLRAPADDEHVCCTSSWPLFGPIGTVSDRWLADAMIQSIEVTWFLYHQRMKYVPYRDRPGVSLCAVTSDEAKIVKCGRSVSKSTAIASGALRQIPAYMFHLDSYGPACYQGGHV